MRQQPTTVEAEEGWKADDEDGAAGWLWGRNTKKEAEQKQKE